jgi:RNA polymerase sigma-70 factor (ECF subfamily)
VDEARDAVIRRMLEEGRAAWPAIDLDAAAFAEILADKPLGDSLHVADLYLACACAAKSPGALEAFETKYVSQLPIFLAGVERSQAVIDDVKQLVRERLFVAPEEGHAKIRDYSGRGSLTSWLRVVTLRVASNRRRQHKPHAPLSDAHEAEMLPALDPELKIIQTRYKGSFAAALRAAFASLTPRERLLFRMHFVDGLNIDRIGLVFSVHRATVARWLGAAREVVVERTMSQLGDELHLDPADFESLLRVVRSALDVSLQGLLAERE